MARTREAAARGEVSIMVGASAPAAHIRRALETMNGYHPAVRRGGKQRKISTRCGVREDAAWRKRWPTAAERGVGRPVIADHRQGSGDSFVLRNHGMKAMLGSSERAFSTRYATKNFVRLEMAEASGGGSARRTATQAAGRTAR